MKPKCKTRQVTITQPVGDHVVQRTNEINTQYVTQVVLLFGLRLMTNKAIYWE